MIADFFAGWNARDPQRVERLFAPQFDLDDGVPAGRTTVRDQGALRTYLALRFGLNDRFVTVVPTVPERPSNTQANATASFDRYVGDARLRGNAKFVCSDGRFLHVVMSAEGT